MSSSVPVSVVIPAYNAASFLPRAIATVRAQTVDVAEIIVVDDESSDDTARVGEELGARVLRQRRGGPAGARNAGIAVARSEWIATLDADDAWHPYKLQLQFEAVREAPQLGVVFTDFDAISDGRVHGPSVVSDDATFGRIKRERLTPYADLLDFTDFVRALAARPVIQPSTAIFRRDLVAAVGGFPANVRAEDSEFFLRLVPRTRTGFVNVPLVAYARHSSQITANRNLDAVRLELHRHVMSHKARYHVLVTAAFEKEYAKTLYYAAARAASHRRAATAFALLAKSVAVASVTGQLRAVAHLATQSRLIRIRRARSERAIAGSRQITEERVVRGIEIPWRRSDADRRLPA